jgi:hypothetical protein
MLNPAIWGPHAWILLHSITLDYPDCPNNTEKQNMRNFFMSVQHVLPCLRCKKNLHNNYQKYPLTDEVLSSKSNLVRWLIDIHNEINVEKGKKKMSYEEVLAYYDNLYHSKGNTKLMLVVALIILVIFIGVLLR